MPVCAKFVNDHPAVAFLVPMAAKKKRTKTLAQRLDRIERLLRDMLLELRRANGTASTSKERAQKRMETIRKKRVAEIKAKWEAEPSSRPSPEITAHVQRVLEHHRQNEIARRLGQKPTRLPRFNRSRPDSKS